MSNHMNIRQLSHNVWATDQGNHTNYFRYRDGIIEARPAGQSYYERIGYINPSLPWQSTTFTFPTSLFGK